jgi:hypothetical protein
MTMHPSRTLNGVACLALLCLVGCGMGSKPGEVRQTFLLQVSTPAQTGAPLPGVLLVAGMDVSEAFAGKQMVYRFEEHRYQSDYYNEFLVAPRDMLGQRVLEWLQRVRLYETVAPLAGTRLPEALVLRGLVNEVRRRARSGPARGRAVLAALHHLGAGRRQADALRAAVPQRHADERCLGASVCRCAQPCPGSGVDGGGEADSRGRLEG